MYTSISEKILGPSEFALMSLLSRPGMSEAEGAARDVSVLISTMTPPGKQKKGGKKC